MHVIDRRTSQSALAFELHCSCSLHRSRSSPMTMNRKKSKASKSPKATEDVGIPEEDQWRIINQTGILKNLPQSTGGPTVTGVPEEDTPFAEEIFNATLFIIPMSFLLLLMEILVHWQYGRKPTYRDLADRMLPSVPTTRYKQYRSMQGFLFIISLLVGPRMIWIVNRASWRVVMKQCPPLATIWVYTILQLDLAPAVLSLLIVAVWLWVKKMKIIF
ncbi:hypothetical protein AcW2_006742 [Taiwanofungus camphoratus]|nr:hypothetical protein AcW2_006742 [Antrodia cinnamomea]